MLTPAPGGVTAASVRDTASERVPVANPVAVTAVLAGPAGSEIQVVSHLRVVRADVAWTGETHLDFLGQRVDGDDTTESRQ